MVAGVIWHHARSVVEATRGVGGTPNTKIIFDSMSHAQNVADISQTRLSGSYEDQYDHAAGTETNEFTFGGLVDYNQMSLWGKLFFKGATTGTGAGADKTWAFLPIHTSDELSTLLIQAGMTDTLSATTPGVSVPFCVGEELTLAWSKAPAATGITFSARLLGKAATDITVFTGTAPEPTLQIASHVNTQVYIDNATAGTTADNFVTGVSFTLNNNWVPLYSLNATTSAQEILRPNAVTWTAQITRYYANDTERAKYKNKQERAVRLRTTGAALGTTNYRMDLDLYGVWESRTWTDSDGLTMEQLTMSRRYSTSAGTSRNLNVVNALATV